MSKGSFVMPRTKQEIAASIEQATEQSAEPMVPWVSLIPLILNLPCSKGMSATEQREWVTEKPKRAARLAAKEIVANTPGISRRGALAQARLGVHQYLASSDEDVAAASVL